MTIAEFCNQYRIKIDCTLTDENPNMDTSGDWARTATHYRILIRCNATRRTMRTFFSQGSAHTKEPTAADLMDSLRSDAFAAQVRSFDEWCSEFGYDTDSRRALRTYEACLKTAADLRRMLGAEGFDDLNSAEPL